MKPTLIERNMIGKISCAVVKSVRCHQPSRRALSKIPIKCAEPMVGINTPVSDESGHIQSRSMQNWSDKTIQYLKVSVKVTILIH